MKKIILILLFSSLAFGQFKGAGDAKRIMGAKIDTTGKANNSVLNYNSSTDQWDVGTMNYADSAGTVVDGAITGAKLADSAADTLADGSTITASGGELSVDWSVATNLNATGAITGKINPDSVGIGITYPSYLLSISDGTDEVGLYPDGTNANLRWTDGNFEMRTDEGTNTSSIVSIKGKGSGVGAMRIYDEENVEYLNMNATGTTANIEITGASATSLNLQPNANNQVQLFQNAAEGETPEFKIVGYPTGGSSGALEVGVGIDALNTVSFDGLDNYLFDGIIKPDSVIAVGGGTFGSAVGVNKSSPTSTFTVVPCNAAGSDGIELREADDGNSAFKIMAGNAAGSMNLYREGVLVHRFHGNADSYINYANLGVGETSPGGRLHVKGSGNTNSTKTFLLTDSDGDTSLVVGDDGAVQFGQASTITIASSGDEINGSAGLKMTAVNNAWIGIDNNDASSSRYFGVYKNGSASNFMLKVEESGNVGISTDSPSTTLDVAGSIRSSVRDTVASAATLTLDGGYNVTVITGTTNIDSIDTDGTVYDNQLMILKFEGALQFTTGKNIVGPAANITTSDNDIIYLRRYSDEYIVEDYQNN
jgi:hypothetical protein